MRPGRTSKLFVSAMVAAALPVEAGAQQITERTPLRFGTVAGCAAPAGIRIETTNGAQLPTGCAAALGGMFNAGQFRVRGILIFQTQRQVLVSVFPATATLTNGGGQTLTVNDFNLVTNAGGPTATVTIGRFQPFDVDVGARLNLKSLQPAGTYTGSYTVTANYL